MRIDAWSYKDHRIVPWEYIREDCIKMCYDVFCPDGIERSADVSPYGDQTEVIKKWIDLGYPKRIGVGPLSMKDLDSLSQSQNL